MLQQALLSLIRRKRYEAISVTEICAAANVGRSTFYAHFTGKDDLKRSGLEHLHNALRERGRGSASMREGGEKRFLFTRALLQHARDQLETYRALKGGRGAEVAMGAIRGMLAGLIGEELAAAGACAHGLRRDLAAQYAAGGCMAVLTWWLDTGAELPPEEVDAALRLLLTGGTAAARR